MRLFVAIPMSENMKGSLGEVQKQMQKKGCRGNFTSRDNLHMTVAFIGEQEKYLPVLAAMKEVPLPDVTLQLSRLGHFGELYWVGTAERKELEQYVVLLREGFRTNSIPFDPHPFLPHITVARRVIAPKGISITVPNTTMRLRKVCLMESYRNSNGRVIYRELGSVHSKVFGIR